MRLEVRIKLGIIALWVGYSFTVALLALAIASSPWFSFQYNWLSDMGNSAINPNTFYGIPVKYIFDASLMIGGLGGIIFTYAISPKFASLKGRIAIALFYANSLAIFFTGLFSEDFGILHTISSLALFILIPISLLAFSFSMEGWAKKGLFLVSICSLLAFCLLFLDRPWGGNAIVELIPCAALGVGLAILTIKLLKNFPY